MNWVYAVRLVIIIVAVLIGTVRVGQATVACKKHELFRAYLPNSVYVPDRIEQLCLDADARGTLRLVEFRAKASYDVWATCSHSAEGASCSIESSGALAEGLYTVAPEGSVPQLVSTRHAPLQVQWRKAQSTAAEGTSRQRLTFDELEEVREIPLKIVTPSVQTEYGGNLSCYAVQSGE